MKKLITIAFAFTGMLLATSSFADDKKEKTFTGEGKCGKCALSKTEKCQMALEVKEDGKKVVYLLENNDVAKAFHSNICTKTTESTVKGTVKEVDGQKIIVASKIDKAAAK